MTTGATVMALSLSELALDSNCLSYIIDALEGVAEPADALAEQRVALVRLYLYTPGTLWTLPTVKQEFSRITDPVRRARTGQQPAPGRDNLTHPAGSTRTLRRLTRPNLVRSHRANRRMAQRRALARG